MLCLRNIFKCVRFSQSTPHIHERTHVNVCGNNSPHTVHHQSKVHCKLHVSIAGIHWSFIVRDLSHRRSLKDEQKIIISSVDYI